MCAYDTKSQLVSHLVLRYRIMPVRDNLQLWDIAIEVHYKYVISHAAVKMIFD